MDGGRGELYCKMIINRQVEVGAERYTLGSWFSLMKNIKQDVEVLVFFLYFYKFTLSVMRKRDLRGSQNVCG